MKKFMFFAVIACMMLSSVPSQAKTTDNSKAVTTATAKSDVSADAAQLAARLDEINAVDMSTLSKSEKKELKSEVKAIKAKQEIYVTGTHHHHGVYYGLGGVLLVVLIVILIV